MHLKFKGWRRFWCRTPLQKRKNGRVMANFARSPKTRFFLKKEQRGDQGKFFENLPKSSPCSKGPKALWRKLNYTLVEMRLKCKDWKIFWRKQRLQKCPNGQVMAIIARSPKTCIFRKSAKGRPIEVFQKTPKKSPSLQKANSTLAQMSLSCKLHPLRMQRLKKSLAQKAAPKRPE